MAGVAEVLEDAVVYCLFVPLPDTFDDKLNVQFLEKRLDACLADLSDVLVGYIWQKDPFNLRVSKDPCVDSAHQGVCPLHLTGRTAVGDNIEDEWFIVHLLLRLSNKFPDFIISVSDTDGQFLLIEAADVIPKWLQPDTSENRVFLHHGKLHLIPVPQKKEDAVFPFFTPSIEEALTCIKDHATKTEASTQVQAAINARLKGYPEKSRQLMHRAHCYVPAALAVILKEAPNLVGAAVETFVQRDPNDLQACRTFTHFRPGTRIMTEVRFNRCQYAQLIQQRFTPDKRSGFALPAPSHKDYKKHDLGMKLAHGFEILCSRCSSNRTGAATYRISSNDVRWNRYLKALKEKGFFRGEIEGSKLHRELTNKARLYFEDMINSSRSLGQNPGRRANDILDRVDYNIDKLRQQENNLEPEDDDGWLTVDEAQLEKIFRARGGIKKSDEKNVIDSMKAFVDHVSSYEGAEFPDDSGDEEEKEGTGFIHNMQKMFEFDDDHHSSSGMSEYSDDDDPEHMNNDKNKTAGGAHKVCKSPDELSTMAEYMQLMDRQLAKTKVGESFVKHGGASGDGPVAPPRRKKQGKQPSQDRCSTASVDIDDLDDDFRPVNVDMNLVQNMLDSYQSQQGQAGPASNLMAAAQAKDKTKKKKK